MTRQEVPILCLTSGLGAWTSAVYQVHSFADDLPHLADSSGGPPPTLVKRKVTYGRIAQPCSALHPMVSRSSREGSRVVHSGNLRRPCLQLFRDTTMAVVSQVRPVVVCKRSIGG